MDRVALNDQVQARMNEAYAERRAEIARFHSETNLLVEPSAEDLRWISQWLGREVRGPQSEAWSGVVSAANATVYEAVFDSGPRARRPA